MDRDSESEYEEEVEEEFEEESGEEMMVDPSPPPFVVKDSGLDNEHFTFINVADIKTEIDNLLSEYEQMFQIPSDDVLRILLQFQWKRDTVQNKWFDSPERILFESGCTPANPSTPPTYPYECPICYCSYEQNDIVLLNCGHGFCKYCFTAHLKQLLKKGQTNPQIRCPQEQCTIKLPSSLIKSFNEPYASQYNTIVVTDYIGQRKNLRWCPGANCPWVIRRDGLLRNVACLCGTKFCFECGGPPHMPVSCELRRKWLERIQADTENLDWITANTKQCPKCRNPIEKNEGCNHMTCRACRHEFCWICLGDWKTHGSSTGGYYSCNRPKNVDLEKKQMSAKARIEYFTHYLDRYVSHQKSHEYAEKQKKNILEKQENYMRHFNCGRKVVEFLADSVDLLVDCRNALMNSYILGFYLAPGVKKDLFEMQQQQLEASTERLSELTEKKVPDTNRQETLDFIGITSKFLHSMLEGMVDSLLVVRTDL
ncbi:putative E3 ubiquitin-protein ligase dbl4 [Blattamonas nauphoetae]|uniref:RBR-type E3 ubiquitin transferase n=1 Tax=Blattamonas nauphoetae TaxID=2049346 RepID=A0ABQ9YGI2_9EUKA|nr:putative E3 ubiquitin-protein ligase dbl4 [Blattamonas nauphoetae]